MRITPWRKPWRIATADPGPGLDGIAIDDPGLGKIRISPKLSGRARLEAIIHEVAHACDMRLTERLVSRIGACAAEAVHAAGFREVRELSEF